MSQLLGQCKKSMMQGAESKGQKLPRSHKHLKIPVRKIHGQITNQRGCSKISDGLFQLHSAQGYAAAIDCSPDKILNNKIYRSHKDRDKGMSAVSAPFLISHEGYRFAFLKLVLNIIQLRSTPTK